MKTAVGAIECALAHLFDYAGMFPPAQQDLASALGAYRAYRRSGRAPALGGLVVRASDLATLVREPLDALRDLPLAVLASEGELAPKGELTPLHSFFNRGLRIEAVELKAESVDQVMRLKGAFPSLTPAFVEIPLDSLHTALPDALAAAGFHAKLRLGGVVAQAIPGSSAVAAALQNLAGKKLAFKATAGLHHPLRSLQPLNGKPEGERATMHGFINLLCASAHLWFGGDVAVAEQILEERDPHAWQHSAHALRWRNLAWSADQLCTVRERFLLRIGSCSFTEPLDDLEALAWL